ncbi:hypothetical protein CVT25_001435 [Psilocybe cyanescens]|uniref:DUF300-domain-containing protein n=1 Tax=Psilocybe cyanescens TaxID=93625 RepID=A0A409WNQ5_PSICY|nr:hypothetical protein CVT25_001435 [Psilocybe cyanescens]
MAGEGAGSRLPTWLLLVAGLSALIAVLVSMMSIFLQLRNYRKPSLQRMVVRIMLMVPLYAIASLISLFSVEAAFVIDAIRDVYEAFVIYCFFVLLLSYLGGERSLLILLHGRPPKEPVFPINLVKREIDVSDPYTFLFLKRGILQYVQVKPILAAVTLILKAVGKYNDGDFRANSGYLYVSIVYNPCSGYASTTTSNLSGKETIFITPKVDANIGYSPVPKFLCVKGILFFSFWQSIAVSTLVAARVIRKLGPYTDPEPVSVGINDLLISVEMPFFAFAHMYAFSYKDFMDPTHTFVARMPMYYAFRDAFGLLDVIEDTKTTLRGEGMDYREFEPAEGFMHQGAGRDRRIRAGLRYSKGGQRKYWLPKATEDTQPPGRVERITNKVIKRIAGADQAETVTAPLLPQDAENVVHLAPDLQDTTDDTVWGDPSVEDGYDLPFGDLDDGDEELFAHSKRYLFGDYNYPCIDVSSESARTLMWTEEERVLRDERGAWFSPIRGAQGQAAMQNRTRPVWEGYGAVDNSQLHPQSKKLQAKSPERFFSDDTQEQRLIDHDARAAEPTDVSLRWTKTKSHSRPGASSRSPAQNIRTVQQQSARHTPSSSVASASGSSRGDVRSPPSLSREPSRPKAGDSPVLPPDAVDLVVEDKAAAEEDLTRERRKGEPATRGGSGLRRIYRRGFVAQGEDGERAEGEVEVEEQAEDAEDARRVEVGEEIVHAIGDDSGDDEEVERFPRTSGHSDWVQDVQVEGVVARTGTPPLHARVEAYQYHDIPEDDNPWA